MRDTSVPVIKLNAVFSRGILCPDGKTSCGDQNTCCPLITGGYGCCNKPQAHCCGDKLSCCPRGYTCDPNSDKCIHDVISTPKLKEVPGVTLMAKVCPDESTVCGMNDTCCQHLDKSWACCPTQNAVCCDDGSHCCPQNYTCDLLDSTCKRKEESNVPLIEIKTRLPVIDKLTDNTRTIICPDESVKCKDEQVCCQLNSGIWGCCPSNEAVCCSDKQHCCPKGFRCESNGKCNEVITSYQDLL